MRSLACKISHKFEMFFRFTQNRLDKPFQFLDILFAIWHSLSLMVLVLLDSITIARNLGSSDFNFSRLSPQF